MLHFSLLMHLVVGINQKILVQTYSSIQLDQEII